MKRQITSLTLLVACLFGGVSTVFAKKKPVIENIQARLYSPPNDPLNKEVRVAIYEYSTDQELQDLAQAFARRGKDGLVSALGRMKKGYMQFPGAAGDWPVELVESKSLGAMRRLTIVAQRGQSYSETPYTQQMPGGIGRTNVRLEGRFDQTNLGQEYPYICVQVEFDEQGNGKGEIVVYAKLGFDSAGHMTINRWNTRPFQLVDVRSSK
jgi:hypothetical protein